jgi:hypothetical protein
MIAHNSHPGKFAPPILITGSQPPATITSAVTNPVTAMLLKRATRRRIRMHRVIYAAILPIIAASSNDPPWASKRPAEIRTEFNTGASRHFCQK